MDTFPRSFEHTLISNLVKGGIRTFCIAPGSRSTPLVAAVHNHPLAKTVVHYDERGLAFFALGMAKALKKGVALITTSGTAVGNCMPAVMEASASALPLLVLTADRPRKLHDAESNQTCDQEKVFGSFCKTFQTLDASIPDTTIASIASYVSTITDGPIHINCQFDEPFLQNTDPTKAHVVTHTRGAVTFSEEQSFHLAGTLSRYERGIILISECSNTLLEPIRSLARKRNWPIYTDITSPMRSLSLGKYHVPFTPGQPLEDIDCVLQLGSPFVSKTVRLFLENHTVKEHIIISPKEKRIDPYATLTQRYIGPIESLLPQTVQKIEVSDDTKWLEAWERSVLSKDPLFSLLAEKDLQGFQLFIGNSMAIRRANNTFYPQKHVPVYASRGLSGIDGQIATACGLAHATNTPTLAIIGDQTYLHDINSLPLIHKSRAPVLLIVANNSGGAIFSKLPVGQTPLYEEYFFNKQTYPLPQGAELFSLPSTTIDAFLQTPTSGFIEIKTPAHEEAHL